MRSWRSCDLARLVALIVPLTAGCQAEAPAEKDTATHFRTVIGGAPVHLALADCEVFLVAADGKREQVLSTDFYPMFSTCMRQDIAADAGFIIVHLGRQALGAGGCCATGGTWRSRDGKNWERRIGGKWVKEADAAAALAAQSEETR